MVKQFYDPFALLKDKRHAELVSNTENCDINHEKSYFGQHQNGTEKLRKMGHGH